MLNVLTLDVESTIYKYPGERKHKDRRGSVYSKYNKLVSCCLKWADKTDVEALYFPNLKPEIYDITLKYIQARINQADIVVGFNIKYDLAWLKQSGVDVFNIKQVWDCQIAEFLLESQRNPYPSLAKTCEKYNIPTKMDIIELEYWNKCIDTDEIPKKILLEYNKHDVIITEQVFKKQYEQFIQTI